ncbi:restriction endonuclease subunit S [Desulfobacter latus]|uniref:Restriction endonuclease subunit S n=1 Tax=Desulfobacter latus TaxID=2292 RepID=A0A850SUI6_9BACT|nr:restriction endonuclease subunit S [Desulfobacter latus]NWH03680.1 restriction endonuclease subunit S [Desulfobacter latus]
MENEWIITKIDDLKADSKGSIAIGPFGSRMKSDCYVDSGIPVIRGTNITGGPNFEGEFVYITEEKADTLGSSNVYQDDLIFPHRGAIGEVGILLYDKRFVLSSSLMKITCDPQKAFPKYLYYFFKSHIGKHELLKNASQVGTPGIGQPLTSLRNIELNLPPLSEQKTIAHTLGSLDNKIELNRQMNATLEGMAQALFKSWFVDFDPVIDNALAAGNPIPEAFAARAETRRKALAHGSANREVAKQFPAAFQFTEEMGWIPEGWEISQLHTLIDLIGGGTPKTSVDEYWNGSIPWFSVVDAPNNSDVFVIDTDKKITELGLEQSSTKILREGSTIISARGTVGKCALVGKEMAMNQSCYGIHGANGIADIYTYYTIRQFVSDLQHRGHGSVFNTITRDTFQSIYVPFGKVELTRKFDQDVNPLLKRIRFNLCHNTELTNLRDTLLPKLISGEIRIPEAEKITEEALA